MKLKPSQIKSNPNNPRIIKDNNFKRLVQSIKDFPEMSEVREVVVNKDYMILGGNMRYKAMVEAGWKEIPVRVVDWTEEQQAEFIIKDNASHGEWDWDTLANQWDRETLVSWGAIKENFDPMVNPLMNVDPITADEIETKARELATQMVKERGTINAVCPDCGCDFEIQA